MRRQIVAAFLAAPALALAQGAGQAGSTGSSQQGTTGAGRPGTGTAGPTGAGAGSGTTRTGARTATGPATGTGVATCPPGTLPALSAGLAPSSGLRGSPRSANQTGATAGSAMGTGSAMAGTEGTTGSTGGVGAGTSSAACVPVGMTTPGALGTSSVPRTGTGRSFPTQIPESGGNAAVAPPAGGAVEGSGTGAVGSVGGTSAPGPNRP
jgi:hypothetical protein